MKYKLVVFDLDGTLLDTIRDLGEAVNHALALRGLPQHNEKEYALMVGNGVRKLVERALPAEMAASESTVDAVLADFMDYYCSHIDVYTRPYPGMAELVGKLDAAGVRMAVASNKFQSGAESLVRKFFPGIAFVRVMGGGAGFPLKPDPQLLADIISAAGVGKEDCVMVGDSGTDVATARNAGVASVGVLWGFRPAAAREADSVAATAEELENLL